MASAVLLVTTDLLLAEDSASIFSYLIIISAIITPQFQNYIHSTKDRGNQNSALLYVVLKILATIVTAYVLQRHSNTLDTIESLKTFFSSVMVPETMNLSFCVLIVSSSFLCQSVLYVTTYSIRTKINIHLSMYLSAVIVSIVVLLSCITIIDVSSISWLVSLERGKLDMNLSQTVIPLYVTVGGLHIIPIFLDFINNRHATHQRNINSFCNSVFPLQCMISYMTSTFSSGHNTTSSRKKIKKRRIFICTTMYQESQIEMDRLLSSIKNVSVSDLLRRENIDIESHIFLDNGANGQDIKQFGLQLLALIEDNLVTDNEQGIMLFTPYGIQLAWQLASGMPLFVHLKDVSKVKAKKRWSQVMYMKYVLSYRSFKCRNISSNLSKISSYASLLSVDSMASMGEKTKTVQNNLKVPESRVNNTVYDSDVNSTITETTSVPYVEIFVGDTSSVGNLSEKPDAANSIFTTDTNNMYTDDFDLDTDEYILATDADMTFVDGSIMDVLHMCESDTDVGAVCGRTRPKGVHIHPIVWLQMFDYAKGKNKIFVSVSDMYGTASDLVFTICLLTLSLIAMLKVDNEEL